MTTRYYELTECKHGKFEPHNISDAESGRLVEWEGPYKCPGGQRRELTVDYEAAVIEGLENGIDEIAVRAILRVAGVPLEEPADG